MSRETRIIALEKRHEEYRTRIKCAALKVIQDNMSGFSLEKFAKAAGISKPGIYYYYCNAEDIIVELAIDIIRDEIAVIEAAVPNGPSAVFRARASFYIDGPLRYEIVHILASRPRLQFLLGELELGKKLDALRSGSIGFAMDLALGVAANRNQELDATTISAHHMGLLASLGAAS